MNKDIEDMKIRILEDVSTVFIPVDNYELLSNGEKEDCTFEFGRGYCK